MCAYNVKANNQAGMYRKPSNCMSEHCPKESNLAKSHGLVYRVYGQVGLSLLDLS